MSAIWIITKDMRIEDNNVLKTALSACDILYPVFIIDNDQVKTGGLNSLHFMIESLAVLSDYFKEIGSCVHAVFKDNLGEFITKYSITSAFILKGFTPFEKSRNSHYSTLLRLYEIDDLLGAPRQLFLKADGSTYHVFSPYCKSVLNKGGLPQPDLSIPQNINKCKKIADIQDYDFLCLRSVIGNKPPNADWIGGYIEGKDICMNRYYNLTVFLQGNMGQKRPRKDISPHVKFGTVSPRLVYHCGLVEEHTNDTYKEHVEGKGILWRALYFNLMDQNEIIIKPKNVTWTNQTEPEAVWKNLFNLWCTGNTGFDFVDAGMNQLVKSGIMDNEVRMLCANFLVFVYNIDWRYGENFFRYHLVDYDWALNVGNWAWSAQVGMDNPSPNKTYGGKAIRIFNPDSYKTKTRAEKDYRESYIRKWLPRPPNSLQKNM